MQSNTILRSDVGSTEKLMGNNNNLNNNGSPGADIMFQMEDEGPHAVGQRLSIGLPVKSWAAVLR